MAPAPAPERARRPGRSAAAPRPVGRPGLLDRYLLRVVLSRFLICLGGVFAVMMLERTLRLATQMAASGAHLGFLWPMIWNLAPHYLGLALPPAFLAATLLAVLRLDGDLEIEAMLAGGFPLKRIVAVLVGVGLGAALAGLAVVGFLEPLGRYGFRAARDEAANAGWTARLQPLAIQHRGGGVAVTADRAEEDGHRLARVFIQQTTARGGEVALTAAAGDLRLAADGKAAQVVLTRGRFYLLPPSRRPAEGAFVRYALSDPYAADAVTVPRGLDPEELTLAELVAPPPGRTGAIAPKAIDAELYVRLARLAGLPLLPFLALPLGMAGRRGRGGASLAFAAVAIMVFQESLRMAQSLSVIWDRSPGLAVGGVFAAFAAVTAWVFLSSYRLQGGNPLSSVLRWLQQLIDRRPRLAIRAPWPLRLSLGGYVTRRLAQTTLAAWGGLVGMLATIDLFEKTDDIMARGLGLEGVAHYALLRAPVIAEQMAPLAVLAGAVVAFSEMARRGELVALRVLGVSLFQILRMSLPVALAASCLTAGLAEQVSPRAQLALASWWRATAPRVADRDGERLWFRAGADIVTAARATPTGERLEEVIIYRRGPDGMLLRRIAAAAAVRRAGGWRLSDVRLTRYGAGRPTQSGAADAAWAASFSPADIRSVAARPLQTSALDAWRALRGRAATDQSRGYLLTRLHRAAAELAGPLIMLLLALPLAMAVNRTAAPGPYFAYALLGGLVYVTSDGVLTAAAQTGLASACLGAWVVPLLFAVMTATVLIFRED